MPVPFYLRHLVQLYDGTVEICLISLRPHFGNPLRCQSGKQHDVTIYNDVCDHSDRCGHTACEYFDNSSEATRRFLKGLYHSHTLDGLFADKDYLLIPTLWS